jgi:arsenate reductase (thioredoxin)
MSQAFFDKLSGGHHRSRSAGTRPAEQVHPVVVDVMREIGIDLSDRRPVKLTEDLAGWADVVVTMGCGDECPLIPGKTYIEWDLADPAGKPLGEVRVIRDDIRGRVVELARNLG